MGWSILELDSEDKLVLMDYGCVNFTEGKALKNSVFSQSVIEEFLQLTQWKQLDAKLALSLAAICMCEKPETDYHITIIVETQDHGSFPQIQGILTEKIWSFMCNNMLTNHSLRLWHVSPKIVSTWFKKLVNVKKFSTASEKKQATKLYVQNMFPLTYRAGYDECDSILNVLYHLRGRNLDIVPPIIKT